MKKKETKLSSFEELSILKNIEESELQKKYREILEDSLYKFPILPNRYLKTEKS